MFTSLTQAVQSYLNGFVVLIFAKKGLLSFERNKTNLVRNFTQNAEVCWDSWKSAPFYKYKQINWPCRTMFLDCTHFSFNWLLLQVDGRWFNWYRRRALKLPKDTSRYSTRWENMCQNKTARGPIVSYTGVHGNASISLPWQMMPLWRSWFSMYCTLTNVQSFREKNC